MTLACCCQWWAWFHPCHEYPAPATPGALSSSSCCDARCGRAGRRIPGGPGHCPDQLQVGTEVCVPCHVTSRVITANIVNVSKNTC